MGSVAEILLAALMAAAPEPMAAPGKGDSLTIRYFAKVFILPSEDAPLIGLGEDGLRLPVYRRKGEWAQVAFHRTTGWIRIETTGSDGRIAGRGEGAGGGGPVAAFAPGGAAVAAQGNIPVTSEAGASRTRIPFGGWAAVAVLCLTAGAASAVLAAYFAFRRRRPRMAEPIVPSERRALLLAPRQKVIESHLTGAPIPLDEALRGMGFAVEYADSLARCAARFGRGEIPAVLGVDARLGRKSAAGALDLCRRSGRAPVIIFLYNSDDPEAIRPPSDLPQVHYLNGTFSSRHVMELLAPLYHARPAEGEEAVAAGPCSLEGRIGAGGLADILQFLELGRRSGMLSIDDGPPAGIVHFAHGLITFAQTRTAEGADAVLEILSFTRGGFRFYGDKRIEQSNCRLSAFEAALYWAHRRDEAQKISQARVRAWAQGSVAG